MTMLSPPAQAAALLIAAICWLPWASRVAFDDRMPVQPRPPARVGPWVGEQIRYCHSAGCAEEQTARSGERDACPTCGRDRYGLSRLEHQLLPPDTTLNKARFVAGSGLPTYVVSIVISSRERSSIHRPEVCLVGQGSEIVRSFTHETRLGDGTRLPLRVLEMLHHVKKPDGSVVSTRHFYAYSFRGNGHITSSHGTRMWWMAWDRIVRGTAARWAYIAIGGPRDEERQYLSTLDRFAAALAPALTP